jgi:hypothetical protein
MFVKFIVFLLPMLCRSYPTDNAELDKELNALVYNFIIFFINGHLMSKDN